MTNEVLTQQPRRRRALPKAFRTRSAVFGFAIVVIVVLAATLGPIFAPHDPAEIVGAAYGPRGPGRFLGTDLLGRDVLSRVLHGGRSILALGLAVTLVAYIVGLPAGLIAGYIGGRTDTIIMRAVDVLLAFPPLLFLLVVATGSDASLVVMVVAVGVILSPGLTRIVRSSVQEVSRMSYVEAALARGDRTSRILGREILPNVSGILMADIGLRFTFSVLLLAAVNFLGLGLQPPASDWALMVAENRAGLSLQVWAVAAPAITLGLLAIGVNLISDAVAQSLGVSRDAIEAEANAVESTTAV